MITVYGIPNCDSVKKTRAWLQANGIEYAFHDFKKSGVPVDDFMTWLAQCGWETLLNRQGTTWRRLQESQRQVVVDQASAVALMQVQTSVIKRPVVVEDGKVICVGYREPMLEAWLSGRRG